MLPAAVFDRRFHRVGRCSWTSGDCSNRVVRGGAWGYDPQDLRAAVRSGYSTVARNSGIGFRVGRTLVTP